MSEGRGRVERPVWTEGGTRRVAALRGVMAAPMTPGLFILFFAMIGFGALARDAGFGVGEAVFITATVFQLPGQVALVDQFGRSATLTTVAFAVALTAVRLLPMTVVLMPFLRGSGLPRWCEFAGSHFVAITAWVESLRRLPELPVQLRLPFYLGFSGALCASTIMATLAGYYVAAEVPVVISAALLFLTPVYFVCSLIATADRPGNQWALGIGVLLGPMLFYFVPGPDLLLTGIIGGTTAYLIGRRCRR